MHTGSQGIHSSSFFGHVAAKQKKAPPRFELRENSWIIYLRKISEENIKSASFLETHLSLKNIDMVQIRKIDPNNPNVLINELKDVKSGTTMVSYFDKQL